MDITNFSRLQKMDMDTLVAECNAQIHKGIISTRVNTTEVVSFGKGKFLASFVFHKKGLRRVMLVPIVPGAKSLKHHTEEYQNAKYQYCVSILRDLYGKEFMSDDMGSYWEQGRAIIGCMKILFGKDQYCGGDIFINFTHA